LAQPSASFIFSQFLVAIAAYWTLNLALNNAGDAVIGEGTSGGFLVVKLSVQLA
jgi:hypothetical protein